MTEEKGLAVQTENNFYLAPAANADTILRAYQTKHDIIEKVLRVDLDYGTVPGSTKPALLKPGAEKLANMFALAPQFDDVVTIEDWTGAEHGGEPFFYYRQKCNLYKGDKLMGSADGSCNSWEKKYRYRQQERTCPTCHKQTIIKGKEEYGGGWLCHRKKGGCGAKFRDNDAAITGQEVGQIPNPDIAEQVNTILKMAQKRALVAATLIVTGASDYFTQDIDDFVQDGAVDGSWMPEVSNTTSNKQSTQEPEFVDAPSMTEAAEALGATVTEVATDEPVVYTAPTAKIGKNKYPMQWARMFATYTRANQFEVDGILQKLKLAGDTQPTAVVNAVNGYLDAKNGVVA